MEREELIVRLRELKSKTSEYKPKGVCFSDNETFRKWHKDVVRFLRLGGSNTKQEVEDVSGLHFCVLAFRMGGGYSDSDQKAYEQDLDTVNIALEAAIENLSLNLVPKMETSPAPKGHQSTPSIVVHSADMVITGDHNTVSINTLTLNDLILCLDKKIEATVTDSTTRDGLRAQLTALAKHPAFAPLLTIGLKKILEL